MTTTPTSDYVWVQLYFEGEVGPVGQAIKIRPIPEDIDDLKDAVKDKLKPEIEYAPVSKILITHRHR